MGDDLSAFDSLVTDALHVFWSRHPVGASFAGETAFDHRLPDASAGAIAEGDAHVRDILRRFDDVPTPDTSAARIDARMLRSHFAVELTPYARRARYENPAWYTGEIAFGIIAHLLPSDVPRDPAGLRARIAEIPDFLRDASAHLAKRPLPAPWVERARGEIAAIRRLLENALPQHPLGALVDSGTTANALDALGRFVTTFEDAPDSAFAAGEAHLQLVMQKLHAIEETPQALERRARRAFDDALGALEERARDRDASRPWRDQIQSIGEIGPERSGALQSYADWHARAMRDAQTLLSPADDYALNFAELPAWAALIANDLYFLFYRSPAAQNPGIGSTYWVTPLAASDDEIRRAHNTAAVKLIHAVHHGSIGHHTQNARARVAGARTARIAGTDAASGIAMLGAGTMVEGWACYAEDLLDEVPGFYTDGEQLMLAYFELRNAASCIADIQLHLQTWTLAEMRRFYREDAAFAPSRIGPETIRNSMFPGSRLMYWYGTDAIKSLRRSVPLATKTFHDTLLGFGSAPVASIAREMLR